MSKVWKYTLILLGAVLVLIAISAIHAYWISDEAIKDTIAPPPFFSIRFVLHPNQHIDSAPELGFKPGWVVTYAPRIQTWGTAFFVSLYGPMVVSGTPSIVPMKPILGVCIIAILATGCIAPDPHTTERLHPVQGHVVDAFTGEPIAGARVAIDGHPHVHTKTDKKGYFHFSKRRNYHWGYVAFIVVEDAPQPKHWSPLLDISHSGYISRKIDAASYQMQLNITNTQVEWMMDRWQGPPAGPFMLKNILLTPTNSPSNTALVPTAK